MLLNTNTGMVDATPITFTTEEAEDMAQISFNQRRLDDMITFKTDDPNISFQILQGLTHLRINIKTLLIACIPQLTQAAPTRPLTSKPVQSQHWLNKRRIRNIIICLGPSTTMGGLSNPSPVFEIELYNDGGVGYPIIRHYEFGQD